MPSVTYLGGEVKLWTAAVGTAEPDIETADGSIDAAWVAFGDWHFDEDGVTIETTQATAPVNVLNETAPIGFVRTAEGRTISGSVKNLTLETIGVVTNRNTPAQTDAASGVPGYKTLDLYQGVNVAEFAVLIRLGNTPYAFTADESQKLAQLWLPRMVQTANSAITFSKTEGMVPFEFGAVLDRTLTQYRFGRWRATNEAASG